MRTLAIDDELYGQVTRRAATERITIDALVEAAVRAYLRTDDVIDRIHQRNRGTADEDVLNLAHRELDAHRADRGRPSTSAPRDD